jgi:ankyrin repeat protein
MNLHEQLMTAIAEDNVDEVRRFIQSGIDLNARCDQGTSALYGAILHGNISIIQLMLEHGADPNLLADEPAASIYTEKPLELAMQARFLMDWNKYHPVVKLLERYGATDSDGRVESSADLKVREQRAKEWQASKSVQHS